MKGREGARPLGAPRASPVLSAHQGPSLGPPESTLNPPHPQIGLSAVYRVDSEP